MKNKLLISVVLLSVSACAMYGCSMPQCHEGELVCMDDHFSILQSDYCTGQLCDDETNHEPCQLYRCTNDNYMPVNNGTCSLGSQVENGKLRCTPNCNENEIVCATGEDTESLDVKQSSMDAEGSVNEIPCQKYKCSNNTYFPMSNSDCSRGSQIKDGSLSCIPKCHENEIVCAVGSDTDHLEVKHSNTDEEGSVNEEECWLYRCSNNNYSLITNGHCYLGSQLENGMLSCIPKCNENEIVCAVGEDTEHLDVKQSSMDAEGSVNEIPCQKYKCTNNVYNFITNGDCKKGSYIKDGVLSCIPLCNEGEIVCATGDDPEQLNILQSTAVPGDSVNDDECQLYRCTNEKYNVISDGYCKYGSRSSGDDMKCREMCEVNDPFRCKEGTDKTYYQYCSGNRWVDLTCDESCMFDIVGELDADGYRAGKCGECQNNMQQYYEKNDEGTYLLVECSNGTFIKKEESPENELTECGYNKYVDLSNDPTNCGSCFNMCSPGESCIDGVCQTEECGDDGYMVMSFHGKKVRAYCINTASDLKKMNEYLVEPTGIAEGDTIRLNSDNAWVVMDDITYSDTWTTPGIEDPIDGITIIGKGHQITFENKISASKYAGLFGQLKNSEIDSLDIKVNVENESKITDASSNQEQATGGFAAIMEDTVIHHSHLIGESTITGSINLGGIAGKAIHCTISDSGTSGTITTNAHNNHIEDLLVVNLKSEIPTNMGGMIGVMENSTLSDSEANVIFKSAGGYPVSSMGGFVGLAEGTNSIISCRRNSPINNISGHSIGGIVGKVSLMNSDDILTINKSNFTSNIFVLEKMYQITYNNTPVFDTIHDYFYPSEAIGGLIGETIGTGTIYLNNNYVNTKIDASGQVGGYIGRLVTNVEIDGCLEYKPGTHKCSIYSDINDVRISAYRYAGGLLGYSTGNQNIRNIKQKTIITNSGNIFCHDGCLYLDPSHPTETSYEPNLHLFSYGAGGLIGTVLSGNLNIDDAEINSTVVMTSDVGGLIGYSATDGIILNVSLNASLKAYANAGGYLGRSESTITKLLNTNFKNVITVNIEGIDPCQLTYIHPDCKVLNLQSYESCSTQPDYYIGYNYVNGIPIFCRDDYNTQHIDNYVVDYYLYHVYESTECDSYCVKPRLTSSFGGIIGESRDTFLQMDKFNLQVMINRATNAGGLIGNANNYILLVSDFKLSNSTIHGTFAGGGVGVATGKAEWNSVFISDSNINGTATAGGLIGKTQNYHLKLTGAFLQEVINSSSSSGSNGAGGVIGSGQDLSFEISDSLINSRIASVKNVGGAFGYISNHSQSGIIQESAFLGSVTCDKAKSGYCGGLFGFAEGLYDFNNNTGNRFRLYTLVNINVNKEINTVGTVAGQLSLINKILEKSALYIVNGRTYEMPESDPENPVYYPQNTMKKFGGNSIAGDIDPNSFSSDSRKFPSASLGLVTGSNNVFSLTTFFTSMGTGPCTILVKGDTPEHDRCVKLTRYPSSLQNFRLDFCIKDESCPTIE